MTKAISFDEFVGKKRKRPEQICFKCGKVKEIYTHADGDEDKPLCNACNMKLRRESPGAIQIKLLKLCATAIGSVEAMLGLPIEEKQKKTLQRMQDDLKLMVRAWLGDPQADEEATSDAAMMDASALVAAPTCDEFVEARTQAVSKESDPVFGAAEPQLPVGKNRKARKAAKTESRDAAEPVPTLANPTLDPAYKAYLEAPLA
jgi:hypothetical protein